MYMITPSLRLAVMSLCCLITRSKEPDYFRMGNIYMSVAALEDILLPEVEIMINLKKLTNENKETAKILKSYIADWKGANVAAALENKKERFELFLENRKKMGGLDYIDDNLDYDNECLNCIQNLTNNSNDDVKPDLTPDMKESILEVLESSEEFPHGAGIHHPIDAYLLVKRLSFEWKKVQDSLKQLNLNNSDILGSIQRDRKKYYMPVLADMYGAASNIVRLQNLYNMDMETFGNGIIEKKYTMGNKDLKSIGKLRPWDYILIGREAHTLGLQDRALEWFKQAVRSSEEFDGDLSEEEQKSIPHFRKLIHNIHPSKIPTTNEPPAPLKQILSNEEDKKNADKLCSGETLLSIEEQSKLYCNYERVSLYFTLMPLKVEVIHDVPRVVLLHDFITENETDMFIKRSRNNMMLAPIVNGDIKTRLSMVYPIEDKTLPSSDPAYKISRKIEAVTGLHILKKYSSEVYKVHNYWIGGYSHCHVDYDGNHFQLGLKIKTFMIYLNNVIAGGATAFPRLGIKVQPQRGMAIMWFNHFKSLEFDHLTYHTSCPVLHGSKWITIKSISSHEQFLTAPCSLNKDQRHTFPL